MGNWSIKIPTAGAVRYSQKQTVLPMQQARTLGNQGSNKSTQGQMGLFRFIPRLIRPHMSQTQIYLVGMSQELQRNGSYRD